MLYSQQAFAEFADSIDQNLKANDPRFNNQVQVFHRDGSVFKIHRAFTVQTVIELDLINREPYLFCFSEHHGVLYWHLEDVLSHITLPK